RMVRGAPRGAGRGSHRPRARVLEGGGVPRDPQRGTVAAGGRHVRGRLQGNAAAPAQAAEGAAGMSGPVIAMDRPSSGAGEVSAMTMVQALNSAMDVMLERDPNVVVFGEDVGYFGGVFRVTDGLQKKYGEHRVFDTPIAEG